MRVRALLAAVLCFAASAAFGQGTQFPAGTIWGNDTAAQRPGKVSTVTAILDRAFGSTRGSILIRGASGWTPLVPGTLGLPFVSAGAGADPLYQRLGLSGGGTNSDLSATGGTSQFLRQNTVGGAISPIRPVCADLSNAAASCATDATNANNLGSGTVPAARFPALTGVVVSSAGTVATTYPNAAANTMLANWTGGATPPTFNTIPACANDGAHALVYINGTGMQCATISAAAAAATQSEQEAGSITTAFTSPGRQQFHPSSVKAWAYITISGAVATLAAGYNVASVSYLVAGQVRVNYTTSFSSTSYSCVVSIDGSALFANTINKTAALIEIQSRAPATATLTDPAAYMIHCSGDQ